MLIIKCSRLSILCKLNRTQYTLQHHYRDTNNFADFINYPKVTACNVVIYAQVSIA